MKPKLIYKNGFNLRALECPKCQETIIHPLDKKEYEEFMRLKNKEFAVKMRMVGNSYAISIPKEIVDFMKEQEKMINNIVKLSFQDMNRLNLIFGGFENNENIPVKSRVIKAREYKVIKNNKPIFHIKQVSDSMNPKNNKTKIIKKFDNEE
ncbi:MAG: hypothetical protein QXF25_02525 [Candidatus Pacearchaeota archaeon]